MPLGSLVAGEFLVIAGEDGHDWIRAAQKSPTYRLIKDYEVALPLHPEYRTMPMVWYIPPLSPVVDVIKETGHDGEDKNNLFAAIDTLRELSASGREISLAVSGHASPSAVSRSHVTTPRGTA